MWMLNLRVMLWPILMHVSQKICDARSRWKLDGLAMAWQYVCDGGGGHCSKSCWRKIAYMHHIVQRACYSKNVIELQTYEHYAQFGENLPFYFHSALYCPHSLYYCSSGLRNNRLIDERYNSIKKKVHVPYLYTQADALSYKTLWKWEHIVVSSH